MLSVSILWLCFYYREHVLEGNLLHRHLCPDECSQIRVQTWSFALMLIHSVSMSQNGNSEPLKSLGMSKASPHCFRPPFYTLNYSLNTTFPVMHFHKSKVITELLNQFFSLEWMKHFSQGTISFGSAKITPSPPSPPPLFTNSHFFFSLFWQALTWFPFLPLPPLLVLSSFWTDPLKCFPTASLRRR